MANRGLRQIRGPAQVNEIVCSIRGMASDPVAGIGRDEVEVVLEGGDAEVAG